MGRLATAEGRKGDERGREQPQVGSGSSQASSRGGIEQGLTHSGMEKRCNGTAGAADLDGMKATAAARIEQRSTELQRAGERGEPKHLIPC